MADFMSPENRSAHMAKIKGTNTKPEMMLRRLLHASGYRYRLHDKRLPGKPDIVFPGRRKVIFVNGCFWHGHTCPIGARLPKTNTEYWQEKRRRNQERDAEQIGRLSALGWTSLVVWECEIKEDVGSIEMVKAYLEG